MSWDTHDELSFIDGIANHSGVSEHSKPIPTDQSRLEMLLSYQKGIKLRSKWDGLDQKEIEGHLQFRINNLQQSVNKEKK